MPINKEMMASMTKTYGAKTAKKVYYAVEAQQKKKKVRYAGTGGS